MMKNGRYIILFFLWSISYIMLSGQSEPKILLSSDTIDIGDELIMNIELRPIPSSKITSIHISMLDSLGMYKLMMPEDSVLAEMSGGEGDFEVLDPGLWEMKDRKILVPGKNKLFERDSKGNISNQLTLKVWDAGDYMFMVDEIHYLDNNNEIQIFYPEFHHARLINIITPVQQAGDEKPEFAPNKDNLREGWHWLDFKWLYVAIVVIAILFYFFTRPKRKKKKEEKAKEKVVIPPPAHEIALAKMSELGEKKLWQKGEIKKYQTELTYIIREYLENRYKINALESTTREISEALSGYSLESDDILKLKDILQIADLVKFAKAKPDGNIHEEFFDHAMVFINKTKIVEVNIKEESA